MWNARRLLPTARPSPERDPFLDNARYFVMLLVVAGHTMAPLTWMGGVLAGYMWLYSFHMPLFVMLSGYTARSYAGRPHQVRRMVATLVIPYVLVHTALAAQNDIMKDRPLFTGFDLLTPKWLVWYVAALFLWRLTTPIWTHLRRPIVVSVLISLATGLASIPYPSLFGIAKVLGFLPFYVIGLHLHRRHFDTLTRSWVRAVALAALALALVAFWFGHSGWQEDWFYYEDSYARLGVGDLEGLLVRGGILALGVVLAFAALAWVPQRRAWFSALGERTLYCYLLHGFLVRYARLEGWIQDVSAYGLLGAALVVGLCFAAGTLLMTSPVRRLFRPLFESDLRWLFRDVVPAATRPDHGDPAAGARRRPVTRGG